MNSFYSKEELKNIGFKSFGKNVLISKKASIYSPQNISIGSNVRIDDFCILSGDISIGNFIHIAAFCGLFGQYGIEMEDFSGLSSRVSIYTATDDYSGRTLTNPTIPEEYKNVRKGKVKIGKHCIIGSGTVILPKVFIKEGSSIGAMSLVIKSTKEWKTYFGLPVLETGERKKDLLELEQKFLEMRNFNE